MAIYELANGDKTPFELKTLSILPRSPHISIIPMDQRRRVDALKACMREASYVIPSLTNGSAKMNGGTVHPDGGWGKDNGKHRTETNAISTQPHP